MKIKANAKINLSLVVCGKRSDGYHLIDTVMHSVNLYDLVQINKANEISVICGEISQEENIAFKAAKMFFEYTNISGGCEIIIEKNIPTCAGMGGGSADAAAVLCGLNRLYNADLSYETLCDMAVKLGADVPFFIKGGCQRATGIGEVLQQHKPLEKGYFVLAKGDKKPSTAQMYRIIDGNKLISSNTTKILEFISKNDLKGLSNNLNNAFEIVWKESLIKEKLYDFSPLAVALTGSGPTWFAVFEDFESATKLKEKLLNQNIECYLVTPEKAALEFE